MSSEENDRDLARRVLTDRQMMVWDLREVQGVGWKAMSLMLGVSSSTVRDTHRRARQLIGKEMARVKDQDSDGTGAA